MIGYPIERDLFDLVHLAHRAEMPDYLAAAELDLVHYDQLHAAWMRVVCAQQQVLAALTGLDRLTATELGQAIDAGEFGLNDCQEAIRSLDAGDGTGPSDYWLGRCSPTAAFQRLAAWFEATLRLLRTQHARTLLSAFEADCLLVGEVYDRDAWSADHMP